MDTEEHEQPAAGSEHPFASRGFVVAAVLVALIVVAGLVVTTVKLLGADDPEPEPRAEGSVGAEEYPEDPATEVPRSDGSDSACGLPETEKTEFAEWPKDTAWERVGTLDVPSSTAHGPAETEESGFRHCYAKSPEGAVLAAMNYVAMTTDPLIVPDLVEQMYAEGEGRDTALDKLEDDPPGADEGTPGHLAGAQLVSYGADRARVDSAMVVEVPEESIVSVTVDLRWEDGDWKVVTRADGEMVIPMVVIHSMDGYVPTPEEA
ncbi:hypothetical protein [Nocardiopsis baichengensis]|uniref:hypothetical protein n=1 Tax=Nocardiopsis baichengensis TaxID=280240 RepID=UPI00034DD065|nr:hypothetical protein [Nocardiopsis baichengensis]